MGRMGDIAVMVGESGSFRVARVTTDRDLPKMAAWMQGWWGDVEGYSPEEVLCHLRCGLREADLPQTFGLYREDGLIGNELIGMYQITYGDLFCRPDLNPWLANVYIDKAHRGKGLGGFLLSTVRQAACAAGVNELYLYTKHSGLYEKFSWEFFCEQDTFLDDRIQRIYRLRVKE